MGNTIHEIVALHCFALMRKPKPDQDDLQGLHKFFSPFSAVWHESKCGVCYLKHWLFAGLHKESRQWELLGD